MDSCSVSTHSTARNINELVVKAFSVEAWYKFKISNTNIQLKSHVFQGRSGTFSLYLVFQAQHISVKSISRRD